MHVWQCHLIDVELWLASGHFSVAGAELADKVVPVKNKWFTIPSWSSVIKNSQETCNVEQRRKKKTPSVIFYLFIFFQFEISLILFFFNVH